MLPVPYSCDLYVVRSSTTAIKFVVVTSIHLEDYTPTEFRSSGVTAVQQSPVPILRGQAQRARNEHTYVKWERKQTRNLSSKNFVIKDKEAIARAQNLFVARRAVWFWPGIKCIFTCLVKISDC